LIYAGAVIFGMRSFRAAICNYLPAALFLFFVFVLEYARQRNSSHLLGAAAIIIMLIAAGMQQSNVVALGLTHNVLYHVLQGFGLLLLFMSARRFCS
jgi:hypothetical protein